MTGSVVPPTTGQALDAVAAAADAMRRHGIELGSVGGQAYREHVACSVVAAVVPYIEAGLLKAIAEDEDLLEVARLAVEDKLVEWRDERRSMPFRNNGLTIRERDGSESGVIRFGPETAVRIGLRAIAAARVARGTQEATNG